MTSMYYHIQYLHISSRTLIELNIILWDAPVKVYQVLSKISSRNVMLCLMITLSYLDNETDREVNKEVNVEDPNVEISQF